MRHLKDCSSGGGWRMKDLSLTQALPMTLGERALSGAF